MYNMCVCVGGRWGVKSSMKKIKQGLETEDDERAISYRMVRDILSDKMAFA